jgi:hypothetical protein
MPDAHQHSAVVGARGHLIDSKILNTIFDIVIERGGAFEVMDFQIGRTNDDFSRLTLKVSAPSEPSLQRLVEDLMPFGCTPVEEHDALVRVADRDGCVPDDFYSTTNMRTEVRVEDIEEELVDPELAAQVFEGLAQGGVDLKAAADPQGHFPEELVAIDHVGPSLVRDTASITKYSNPARNVTGANLE